MASAVKAGVELKERLNSVPAKPEISMLLKGNPEQR